MDNAFIGRDADVGAVRGGFERGERLVTLVGTAGIGKTRLARELAAKARREGEDAIECDLSEARSVEDIVVTIARAVGLPALRGGDAVLDQIGARLVERARVLLVLDNFEQIIRHARSTVGALLESAPSLRILVTSRERLHLAGERVHELAPLGPAEGVALFIDCVARARGASKHLPEDRAPERAVYEAIVRELDGLPLALELAAVRVGVLGAANVLARLDRRLDVLTRAPDAGSRRTLRRTIDWSWEMLDPAEQSMLARCSVFRGGFSLDSALAIAPAQTPGYAAHAAAAFTPDAAMDALQSLCEKSLIVVRHEASGSSRFNLFLTIREYAAEKLADDETTARDAEARHAAFFVALAATLNADVDTVRGAGALAVLELERENLTAVATRAMARSAPPPASSSPLRAATALSSAPLSTAATPPLVSMTGPLVLAARAAIALAPLSLSRGPIDAFLSLADRLLDSPLPLHLRIELLSARGRCRRRRGRALDANRDQLDAIDLARAAEMHITAARMVGERAMTAYACCAFDAALGLFRQCASELRSLDEPAHEAVMLTKVATVHREMGSLEDARSSASLALPLHRAAGNAMHEAATLAELALVHLETGELASARSGLSQALALCLLTGNRLTEGFIRGWIGVVEHAAGELHAAEQAYLAALGVIRDVGYARFEGGTLGYLAVIDYDRGDVASALARFERARALLGSAGDRRYTALFTGYLASCYRAQGDDGRADVLLDEALGAVVESDPLRTAIGLVHADRAGAPWPLRASEHASCSWDARLALSRIESRPASSPPPGAHARILVALDGAWIEKAPGKRVVCERRAPAMRLLAALARALDERPGHPLPFAELVERGWPGERILPAAAKNRLRVAMSWLRRAGLGDALVAAADGYVLAPDKAQLPAPRQLLIQSPFDRVVLVDDQPYV